MLPTREGIRFLLALLLIGLAALNTGNNLIYLVFSMMMSIVVVSYIALVVNLRGLSLKVSVKRPVFANQCATIDISVKNIKKALSSYSLNILLPEGMAGRGFLTKIGNSSSAKCEVHVFFKHRGVYKYGDFAFESGFPFIFFRKRINIPVEGEITVYPEILDLEEIGSISGQTRGIPTIRAGRGDELLSIREHREGDDATDIDWKSSAKVDKLMVKEFEWEEPKNVSIILDDIEPFSGNAFELAVSYAASVVMKLINSGYYVSFISSAKRLPFGSGGEQLYKILDILADISETHVFESPLPEEVSRPSILILKSESSLLKGISAVCDEVIYADGL